MSQGKYSPALIVKPCDFNCYGKPPAPWNKEVQEAGVEFDEKTMFANYDEDGFDGYGYSAFDADGKYVGIGDGIDRNGYTEFEYMCMSAEDFQNSF